MNKNQVTINHIIWMLSATIGSLSSSIGSYSEPEYLSPQALNNARFSFAMAAKYFEKIKDL